MTLCGSAPRPLARRAHVAEATEHPFEETRSRLPEVPWRRIAARRDILIHDDMGLDLDAVWTVSQEHLGNLRIAVESLLGDR